MIDSQIVILVCIIFFWAGFIKGVIGLGLPTISLALLTIITDLTSAMVFLLAPSLLTNIYQAVNGPQTLSSLRRVWPLLLFCALCVPIGAKILLSINLSIMSAILGGVLTFYALVELFGLSAKISKGNEKVIGGIAGALTGVFTGMTGSCVVPGVIFLKVIDLNREAMIQSMGLLFSVATLSLSFALYHNLILHNDNLFFSSIGVIPAIIGMFFGNLLNKRISKVIFHYIFLLALIGIGLYLMLGALF